MPGMIYNYNSALYPASPLICPTLPVLPVPMVPSIPPITPESRPISNLQQVNGTSSNPALQTEHKPGTPVNAPQFQRPASQATSVKAEPGSVMGSIASASVANKVSSFIDMSHDVVLYRVWRR